MEIVPACDHTVHMVFLVLHRTEQDWILQIHHLGHTATRWTKQFLLSVSRTIDDIVGRT